MCLNLSAWINGLPLGVPLPSKSLQLIAVHGFAYHMSSGVDLENLKHKVFFWLLLQDRLTLANFFGEKTSSCLIALVLCVALI
jgi:hypothetical protein